MEREDLDELLTDHLDAALEHFVRPGEQWFDNLLQAIDHLQAAQRWQHRMDGPKPLPAPAQRQAEREVRDGLSNGLVRLMAAVALRNESLQEDTP
jgi:hypothetical protein